jgi:hypothetical protein
MRPLHTPSADVAELNDLLGQAWGAPSSEPITQYLAWSEAAGIFTFLHGRDSVSLEELTSNTLLNEPAADALICLLDCLKLVDRRADGRICLMSLASEYLVKTSPFYVGEGLFLKSEKSLPKVFLKDAETEPLPGGMRLPVPQRLKVQHSRNFAPSVVAARTGRFDGVRHLVDIAGGSGVLAIPLALDYPNIQITLVELPEAIDDSREMLRTFGVERRIKLMALDVLRDEWQFDPCDGIFFGNFFHSNSDETCRLLARKTLSALLPEGRIWLHEVLFNEKRDGPLLAALWNLLMLVIRRGARQRTAAEFFSFLHASGFEGCHALSTAGGFSLLEATKRQ